MPTDVVNETNSEGEKYLSDLQSEKRGLNKNLNENDPQINTEIVLEEK